MKVVLDQTFHTAGSWLVRSLYLLNGRSILTYKLEFSGGFLITPFIKNSNLLLLIVTVNCLPTGLVFPKYFSALSEVITIPFLFNRSFLEPYFNGNVNILKKSLST